MTVHLLSRLVHYFPLLASLLLLAALVLPPVQTEAAVQHYLLVFDISQSMNVEDVRLDDETTTRFLASKAAARSLIQALPCGSEIGLAVFSATRTVSLLNTLEVCEHYNGLLVSLDTIDGRMRFKNASSIGKGIHQSLRAANEMGDGTAIVFFSDGHEAPPLRDGQTGMPKSEGHDVKGFIIGVGGDALARIPRVDNNGRSLGYWQAEDVTQPPPGSMRAMSAQGGEELSSIREAHLRELAQLSGLEYIRLSDPDAVVDTLTLASIGSRQAVPTDVSWIPALLALLLLCLRFAPVSWLGPSPVQR